MTKVTLMGRVGAGGRAREEAWAGDGVGESDYTNPYECRESVVKISEVGPSGIKVRL